MLACSFKPSYIHSANGHQGIEIMFDENEAQFTTSRDITLGCDLSTFSLEDLDERIELLREEISRLETEKMSKAKSLDAAQAFFKS